MTIKGIESMTIADLQDEVARGGKFVHFTYCFSFIFITLKQTSAVYFVRSNESAFAKGAYFNLVTLLFGWWGIPWGPFHTIGCLFQNMSGGKDLTIEVMQQLHQSTRGHVFEFEPQAAFAY